MRALAMYSLQGNHTFNWKNKFKDLYVKTFNNTKDINFIQSFFMLVSW